MGGNSADSKWEALPLSSQRIQLVVARPCLHRRRAAVHSELLRPLGRRNEASRHWRSAVVVERASEAVLVRTVAVPVLRSLAMTQDLSQARTHLAAIAMVGAPTSQH